MDAISANGCISNVVFHFAIFGHSSQPMPKYCKMKDHIGMFCEKLSAAVMGVGRGDKGDGGPLTPMVAVVV